MAAVVGSFRLVKQAISRNASAGGIGFAGTTGLVASGLTDLASLLGPILFWFFVIASISTVVLAALISSGERAMQIEGREHPKQGLYCHVLLILLGSLFGSGILLLTGVFQEDSEGSQILALLRDTKQGVERIETKIGEIDTQIEGIGQKVILRDISGRSGTGMIGDTSTFLISLENEKLMKDAACTIEVAADWRDRINILDSRCDKFQVQLVREPALNRAGKSAGGILEIAYDVTIRSSTGEVLGSTSGVYPFNNAYRTIELTMEPQSNRLKVNERRRARVTAPGAVIPDRIECEWGNSTNPVIKFIPESSNKCEGWLSTEVDEDSYAYKELLREGEKRGQVYLQLVTSSDFEMLGITELKFSVSQ